MFGCFKNKRKEKIKRYLDQGAVLLDVRTTSEYESEHIEESVHIPLHQLDNQYKKLDKDRPIIAYCKMGGRSTLAASKLKAKGYRVIDGGSIKTVNNCLAFNK
jgi:phage shock protein E